MFRRVGRNYQCVITSCRPLHERPISLSDDIIMHKWWLYKMWLQITENFFFFTPFKGPRHALYFYAAEHRISVKGFTLESPKFTAVLLAPAYVSSISFSLVQSTAL